MKLTYPPPPLAEYGWSASHAETAQSRMTGSSARSVETLKRIEAQRALRLFHAVASLGTRDAAPLIEKRWICVIGVGSVAATSAYFAIASSMKSARQYCGIPAG